MDYNPLEIPEQPNDRKLSLKVLEHILESSKDVVKTSVSRI